jgi:hypothetical protein
MNYDQNTNEMVIDVIMDDSQYERYVENFVIRRDVKKRQDN